jgi:hypothetical protein
MKKISLKEMKGALSRKEMKDIVAGGSLQYFPNGSCCITFNAPCNGYSTGQKICINIVTEQYILSCNYYTNGCTSSNNYCGGMSCGAT